MTTVDFTATLAGSPNDFDATAYRANVATVTGIPTTAIHVELISATYRARALRPRALQSSFDVRTTMITGPPAIAAAVQTVLGAYDAPALSRSLGVTITAIAPPRIAWTVVFPPPPPPPSPPVLPPPSPSEPPPSASLTIDAILHTVYGTLGLYGTIGAGVGAATVLILPCICYLLYRWCKRRRKRREQTRRANLTNALGVALDDIVSPSATPRGTDEHAHGCHGARRVTNAQAAEALYHTRQSEASYRPSVRPSAAEASARPGTRPSAAEASFRPAMPDDDGGAWADAGAYRVSQVAYGDMAAGDADMQYQAPYEDLPSLHEESEVEARWGSPPAGAMWGSPPDLLQEDSAVAINLLFASAGDAAQPAAPPMEPPPPTELPPFASASANGWQPVTAADGSTYYYNPATGETAWERPDARGRRRSSGMITSAFA